jgi:hypothetical protein
MLAWAFPCKTADEVGALLRALGKHRYLLEVDHRLHWSVDAALRDHEPFASRARAFTARRKAEPGLDPSSYEPTLWRSASTDEVIQALSVFWSPDAVIAREAASRLRALLEHEGLPPPEHAAFGGDPEFPTHPQLVQLAWRLLPICDLDPARHAGALGALEASGEEIDVTAPIDQEGLDLGVAELCSGAEGGALVGDFLVWADGPYGYNDYVFRGACKAAKLPDPPEGLRDLDET